MKYHQTSPPQPSMHAHNLQTAFRLATRSFSTQAQFICAPQVQKCVWSEPQELPVLSYWQGLSVAKSTTRSSAAAVAQRLSCQAEFPLILGTPYTLEGALVESEQARVITEVGWRHRLVHVNKAWEELCGYKLSEVEGSMGLSFIQGPGTQRDKIQKICDAIRGHSRVRVTLTNYKKGGQQFTNHVQITPLLGSNGQVTHLLGISSDVTLHKTNLHRVNKKLEGNS